MGDARHFDTGGILTSGEYLARKAISLALYAINNIGSPPGARVWAENTALVTLSTSAPTIILSESITPITTGKLRAIITGVVSSEGDTGLSVNFGVSHGALATPQDYQQAGFVVEIGGDAFALVVDFDKLAAPIVFPLVAVQINVVCTAASTPGISFPPHSVQMEIQEQAL